MIVTYFRSSSFNTYSMCPQQYFIDYVLGWKSPSGMKAEKGTIVHKVMECLAAARKAEQDGQAEFFDKDFDRSFPIWNHKGYKAYDWIYSDKFVNMLIYTSYEHYTKNSKFNWKGYDQKECFKWTWEALNYNGGMFDPRKRNIVMPELHFDFELEDDWADYFYVGPNDEVIKGKLALKGTIDLITEARAKPKIWEVTDWKTGRRLDWATGEEKDYKKLCADPQLRLYHLALSHVYPDVDQFLMTIYFINDGGPFTMAFGKDDIAETKNIIRHRFEEIKRVTRPHLNKTWKCGKICHFGKNPHPKDPSKTICDYIAEQTRLKGLDEVVRLETVEGHSVGYYQAPGSA